MWYKVGKTKEKVVDLGFYRLGDQTLCRQVCYEVEKWLGRVGPPDLWKSDVRLSVLSSDRSCRGRGVSEKVQPPKCQISTVILEMTCCTTDRRQDMMIKLHCKIILSSPSETRKKAHKAILVPLALCKWELSSLCLNFILEVIIQTNVEKELLVVIADKDRQLLKLLFVSNTISG